MSFQALFLAVQAVEVMEPLDDEEFGMAWSDLDICPALVVRWARYRSEGAGEMFGVVLVTPQTFDQWCAEEFR